MFYTVMKQGFLANQSVRKVLQYIYIIANEPGEWRCKPGKVAAS